MKNWIEFTDKEYDRIWDKVYSDYEFSPSVSIFPSFKVPDRLSHMISLIILESW